MLSSAPGNSHRSRGRRLRSLLVVVAAALALAGCSGDDGDEQPPVAEDFDAQAADFECLRSLEKVRNIRLTNKLGHLEEALALARDPQPGKQYPVGTIIQLFPGEAMVKRSADWDPENHSWEYFELDVSAEGTSIRRRGRDEVINRFGGQCFGCHVKAREFDFICETGHGCDALPIPGSAVAPFQDADPRCGR